MGFAAVHKKKVKKKALSHITALFELACKTDDSSLQQRYITLIEKYGQRHRIRIPLDFRRAYCKQCHSLYAPGQNCKVRTFSIGSVMFKRISCSCGTIRRIGLKNQ